MSIESVVSSMRDQLKSSEFTNHVQKGQTVSSKNLPQVSLSSFTMPVNGMSSVMLKVIGDNMSATSIALSASNLFDQQLRVIPGTMRVVKSAHSVSTVSAKVCASNLRVAISDHDNGAPKGFRSISRNIFMDDRDNSTWRMQSDEHGSRVLVKDSKVETEKDLEELLSSVSHVTHHFTEDNRYLQAQSADFKNGAKLGQPLSFVDSSKTTRFGFVVVPDHNGKIGVLSRSKTTPEYVSRCSVVRRIDERMLTSQLKFPQLGISVSSVNASPGLDTIIDYYRKVYGFNKEYFDLFEKQLRSYEMT